jgi:hypothetical protein
VSRKSLILYASMTGNTEKLAVRFKEVFEKMKWECDLMKIDQKMDITIPFFNCDKYDFICLGSYVHSGLPSTLLLNALHKNPGSAHYQTNQGLTKRPTEEEILAIASEPHPRVEPINLNGLNKQGIVFVTFAGKFVGWKMAQPSLDMLEVELAHMHFQCVGQFCCPGRFGTVSGWFKDLPQRPHERDLLKAQIFLEEILEQYE